MNRVLLMSLLSMSPFVVMAEAPRQYPVIGTLRAVLSEHEWVVAHEEIPDFMPAMTMAFQVDAASASLTIQPGTTIKGVLEVTREGMVLTQVAVIATAKETSPAPKAAPGRRLDVGDVVPAFALLDQHHQARSLVTPGKYTVLSFVFTRCPVPEFCPLISSKFAQLQEVVVNQAASDQVALLSVTIDPEFDTPAQLLAYGQAVGAQDSIWSHAVATPEVTEQIVRAFRVYRERNGALLDHTLCTALIAPDGTILNIWRGNTWTPEEVWQAIPKAAHACACQKAK